MLFIRFADGLLKDSSDHITMELRRFIAAEAIFGRNLGAEGTPFLGAEDLCQRGKIHRGCAERAETIFEEPAAKAAQEGQRYRCG